ncbi:MAG: hypothetical protein KDH09_19050 [Chrysiogenetes bacterium]|nr:hypothetical protein [Chrysiogenetes bacterium]
MEETPIVSMVLWTTDIPALAGFLSDVAGLSLIEEYPGYARLQAWNAEIELHGDDDADRRHPWYQALSRDGAARGIGAEIRIQVEDLDAAFATALRRGALSIRPPTSAGDMDLATVMGPDGYFFTLWR